MGNGARTSRQHERTVRRAPGRWWSLIVLSAALCSSAVACGGTGDDSAAGTDEGTPAAAVADPEVAPVSDCGARRFYESDGPPLDLSGCDLSGADLRFLLMQDGSYAGADMSGADLDNAYVESADLSGVNLSGANVMAAYLEGTNLSGADLTGAVGSPATIDGADMTGANLTDACLVSICGAYETPEDIATQLALPGGGLEVFLEQYADEGNAALGDVVYGNTTCPDGTNSDTHGGTCDDHLLPAGWSAAATQLLGQA